MILRQYQKTAGDTKYIMDKSTTLLDQDFVLTAIAYTIFQLKRFCEQHPSEIDSNIGKLQIVAVSWVAENLGILELVDSKVQEIESFVNIGFIGNRKLKDDLLAIIDNNKKYEGGHGQNGHD